MEDEVNLNDSVALRGIGEAPVVYIDFRSHRFEKDIILLCVRWYLAYLLSYRNLEEMMAERRVGLITPTSTAGFRSSRLTGCAVSLGAETEGYIRIKTMTASLDDLADKVSYRVFILIRAYR